MAGRLVGKCRHCGEVRKFEARGLCHHCWNGYAEDYPTLRPGELQAMAVKEHDGSTFERDVRRRLICAFENATTHAATNNPHRVREERAYIQGVRDASQGSVRELANELLQAAGEVSKEA